MMKGKHSYYLLGVLFLALAISSCSDDIPADSYYTFKGETLGQYLKNRPEQYSDFVEVLAKAKLVSGDAAGSTVLSLLNSYGKYTCFAPSNRAMQKYLEKYNLDNVSQMTDSAARVVAFMSVISSEGGQVYEAKNFAAKLPDQNLYRKTIYVTSNPDTRGYLINNMASIERDTLVHNGVIHRVDSVLEPSDLTLLGFFEEHPEYSLFAEAIELTAIYERVNSEIEDLDYVAPASMLNNAGTQMYDFPRRRFFYYTCFVESNDVFAAADIYTLDDLKEYARQWFKDTYEVTAPEIYAAGNNETYISENNYLNRFVAYHFVNKKIDQADFTLYRNTYVRGYDKYYDYAETLAPGQTLWLAAGKNSFADDEFAERLQINPSPEQMPLVGEDDYRGWTRSRSNGVLLAQKSMMDAANGCFHEIESILAYPRETFKKIRMRLDYTALFPEFMSNNIRNVIRKDGGYGLPDGYLTNIWFENDGTRLMYLMPGGWSGQTPPSGMNTWNDYQGDEFIAKGNFDFTIKLPPVPAGTYEVRIGYSVNGNRGCAQLYLGDARENMIAQGIPKDLTVAGSQFGWIRDTKTEEDYETDKLMHANGAMKGPNSSNSGGGGNVSIAMRNVGDSGSGEYAIRRVVGVYNLVRDGSLYVRFRNVADKGSPEFMMDYIEICPSSIYDNPEVIESRD